MIIGLSLLMFKNILSYVGSFFLMLSISIPALYFIPNPVVDLTQYFKEMRGVNPIHNILALWNLYKYDFTNHRFTFLYDIFQWAISKTGIFPLLPFFSVLIAYLCLIIPFIHLRNEYKISLVSLFVGFLAIVSLIPYDSITSTIRWFLSASIFFLITYICIHNNHKYLLLLYLPLIFIHEGMILPILLVVVCSFVRQFNWYYIISLIVLFIVAFIILSHGDISKVNSLPSIINVYSNMNVSSFTQTIGAKFGFYVFLLVPYLYSLGNCFLIRDNKKLMVEDNLELNLFIIFNITDLLLLPLMIIAQRYALLVAIIDINILLKTKENNGVISNLVKFIYFVGILFAFMNFVIGFHGMAFNFTNIISY